MSANFLSGTVGPILEAEDFQRGAGMNFVASLRKRAANGSQRKRMAAIIAGEVELEDMRAAWKYPHKRPAVFVKFFGEDLDKMSDDRALFYGKAAVEHEPRAVVSFAETYLNGRADGFSKDAKAISVELHERTVGLLDDEIVKLRKRLEPIWADYGETNTDDAAPMRSLREAREASRVAAAGEWSAWGHSAKALLAEWAE